MVENKGWGLKMNRTELQKTLAGLTEEIELISDVKIKSIQKRS